MIDIGRGEGEYGSIIKEQGGMDYGWMVQPNPKDVASYEKRGLSGEGKVAVFWPVENIMKTTINWFETLRNKQSKDHSIWVNIAYKRTDQ